MKTLYWFGLVLGILFVVGSPADAAATACPAQPTRPDGTSITSPAPGAVVTSPFTIHGMHAHTFEANVPIRIVDTAGNVLIDATTTALGTFGVVPFASTVTFAVAAPTPVCIIVYREVFPEPPALVSPGEPWVQIPVTLSPIGALPDTGAGQRLLSLIGLALALLSGGVLVRHRVRALPARAKWT